MAKDHKAIIAIDVGSARVRVLAARESLGRGFEVTALGQAASLGVRRGTVENIDEASYAVRAALKDAGLEGRVPGAVVYAGIGGRHVQSMTGQGEARIARGDGTVTEKDVGRAIAAAREMDLGKDRVLVHHIPRGFRVDGHQCRRNPVGMRGAVAQADTLLVLAGAAAVRDLQRAVQMAGKEVDYLVVNGVAAGQASLRPEEKQLGAALLDIGAGSTDVVAYAEGSIFHVSVLPLGGNQLTNDVAIALNTSFHVAERIVHEHGAAVAEGAEMAEEITVPCFGDAGCRRVRRQYLDEVVRLRMTEILQIALAQFARGLNGAPQVASVVITGGVANLGGIERLAEQALRMPARIGAPPPQAYGTETLKGPAFASILGVLAIETDPLFAPVKEEGPARVGRFSLLPQLNLLRS